MLETKGWMRSRSLERPVLMLVKYDILEARADSCESDKRLVTYSNAKNVNQSSLIQTVMKWIHFH